MQYHVVDFDALEGIECPCGVARRAFADVEAFPGTVHRTRITGAAKLHYHERLTETYYVLECEPGAKMQLGQELLDVKPGFCVCIPPRTPHRIVGCATVLIIVLPKFDASDEVIVEE